MSIENSWIPSVGEWIGVPDPVTNKLTHKRVTKRVRKDGKPFVQCGGYLFPLETCQQWQPKRIDMGEYAIVQDPNLWQALNDLWERRVING